MHFTIFVVFDEKHFHHSTKLKNPINLPLDRLDPFLLTPPVLQWKQYKAQL